MAHVAQNVMAHNAQNSMQSSLQNDQNMCTGIFLKTKLCKFKKLNMCNRGAACTYAHSQRELQPLPDLFRTKMCFVMTKNGKCKDARCPYAHTKQELRTVNIEAGVNMGMEQEVPAPYFEPPKFYCMPVVNVGMPWIGQLHWDTISQSTMSGDDTPYSFSPTSTTGSDSPMYGDINDADLSRQTTSASGEDTSCSLSQGSIEESEYFMENQAELPGVSHSPYEPLKVPSYMKLSVKNTFIRCDLQGAPSDACDDIAMTTCLRRCQSSPALYQSS